jgi:hypothetical protein
MSWKLSDDGKSVWDAIEVTGFLDAGGSVITTFSFESWLYYWNMQT